jgi:hypothetical protein
MEAVLVVVMLMQRYRLDLIARSSGQGELQGHPAAAAWARLGHSRRIYSKLFA